MSKNTLSAPSTLDDVIDLFRAHLYAHGLPDPSEVSFYLLSRQVSVKPDAALSLVYTLGNVLMWTYSLVHVTASWWHTDEGDLIVTVWGRGAGGIQMSVFGAGPFDQCHGLVPLTPGQSEDVTVDELHTLHGLLRDYLHAREVG